MPRANREDAKKTRQKIIDASMQIIALDGSHNLTFTNIAKKAGISRSGINAHFAKKKDIESELIVLIQDRIESHLNFSSPQSFTDSWTNLLLTNKDILNLACNIGSIVDAPSAVERLKTLINGEEDEKLAAIYYAIGFTVVLATPKSNANQ